MSAQPQEQVDLSKYVEARFFEQRPHLRGKRIPIAQIARRMRVNSWTIAQTAHDFSISEAEVLAALLYYEEHQNEIDQQEAEDQAQFEAMRRQFES